MSLAGFNRNPELSLGQKILQVNWGLILLIAALAGIGCVMLYSAADGSLTPWAQRHALRFGGGLVLLLTVAMFDIRFWFRWSYPIYVVGVLLLIAVEVMGTVGMGAQRWIQLGPLTLQPSEVMKVAIVMALARYFHGMAEEEIVRPTKLIGPLVLVGLPTVLVLKQPDLGTSLILIMVSGVLFFAAGVRLWKFGVVAALGAAAVPVAWQFLHDYQKQRVLTFLNPESDPLGAGYHIMQSKIALGAGGMFGKGLLEGSQSHLNFLPEKQTDFIFTMLAEEFGLMGGVALLVLYALVILYGFAIALRARNQFGRLLAIGLTANLFLYVFINIAMVMGLIPVVGVPLPLVSYGGTAMLAIMISFGLVVSVYVHRDVRIPRRGLGEED
ncbi:rod shape-determining protein RodA [Rhodovibrio salinarum]|uniref:Peptidoglycan glycosyltransferase MrdB n=1 Tax=Rhodovibrio salinarum TaxID=1087 RepID=A0A934UY52_9PROT|nr:rod shape-determining protein RodA [Rhodovibrio salinarum]MBK1695668.1 rod shape-determining protein RodA [Rhodovibrio salinarum]